MTFWASSIFAMNDPQEFLYGYDVLKEIIQDYEAAQLADPKHMISSLWKEETRPESGWKEQLINALYEQQLPYILSFSHERDSLPLWNMYGGNGTGVSICFWNYKLKISDKVKDVTQIIREKLVLFDNLNTHDIEYGEYSASLIAHIHHMLDKYIEATQGQQTVPFHEKIRWLATILVVFGARIKDRAYEFEKEARFIEFEKDLSKVKFRTNNRGHIIAYIEKEVPLANLRYITIGPCVDFLSVKSILETELRQKGITVENIIRKSQVPYRNY